MSSHEREAIRLEYKRDQERMKIGYCFQYSGFPGQGAGAEEAIREEIFCRSKPDLEKVLSLRIKSPTGNTFMLQSS